MNSAASPTSRGSQRASLADPNVLLARGRALVVRRGSPPSASVTTLPQQRPSEGEVLVQLHAAALTATDVFLCQGPPPPLAELLAVPAGATIVPGCFFYGEVLLVGNYVEGLDPGEPVIGVIDGPALAGSDSQEGAEASSLTGGCFRECVRVHFSALLPAAELVSAGLHMPAVVAHLPPMINAVFYMATHLRLRPGEALLVLAPKLGDVLFLFQRLLLIADAWSGPLYLVLLQGHAPTRVDLERHSLLRPLLTGGGKEEDASSTPSSFLEDFTCWSVEEHMQQSGTSAALPDQVAEALREVLGRASAHTRGMGFDVVLALDVELGPQHHPQDMESRPPESEELGATASVLDAPPRPPMLLRALLGALAFRGRLVTNCRRLEMMPADSEHMWLKEASLSLLNSHGLVLSGARHGALLHAMAEVAGRIARAELPVADAEVSQYRLFEQFHPAYDAVAGRGSRAAVGAGTQLVALIV